MHYNIDFLVASVAFIVAVVPFYIIGHDRSASIHGAAFSWLILLGVGDIALDIITAVMYENAAVCPLWVLHFLTEVFFALQCIVPLVLFLYVVGLASEAGIFDSSVFLLGIAPFCAMVLLVLSNPFTGLLFSFDLASHEYVHGPLYILMYLQAFFYALLSFGYAYVNRNSLRSMELAAIGFAILILFAASGLQYLFPDVLITGLGIGLALIVFLVALTNPFDMTDSLTGTLELSVFTRRIRYLIAKGVSFGVVFISLDSLRLLNSLEGRSFGDSALKACSRALMGISKDGRAYRLKGARFAVLTDSMRETRRVYGDIMGYFSEVHVIDGRSIKIDASIWSIEDGARVTSPEEMQGYMDYLVATMRNKELSCFASANRLETYRRYSEISRFLSVAVEEDLFELYVQPVIDARTNVIASCEALARLKHPEMGYLSPGEFIAIAEEEGKIGQISELQFEKICRYLKENGPELEQIGLQRIKVNLSPIELARRDAPERILSCMERYGLSLTSFSFEITEGCATEFSAELQRFIDLIINRGATLFLDDFGSGFANYEMLLNLPFTGVKIDRTLLSRALSDERTASMYRGIVNMMRDVGLVVVAEGIESEDQDRTLRDWGVDELQGFLHARPMPVGELCDFVRNRADNS